MESILGSEVVEWLMSCASKPLPKFLSPTASVGGFLPLWVDGASVTVGEPFATVDMVLSIGGVYPRLRQNSAMALAVSDGVGSLSDKSAGVDPPKN